MTRLFLLIALIPCALAFECYSGLLIRGYGANSFNGTLTKTTCYSKYCLTSINNAIDGEYYYHQCDDGRCQQNGCVPSPKYASETICCCSKTLCNSGQKLSVISVAILLVLFYSLS